MKVALFITLLLITSIPFAHSQSVGINTTGTPPHASAILDVESIDKGILIPRMTSLQRDAIASPTQGLFVFDTDTRSFWFYSSQWHNLATMKSLTDGDSDTKIQVEKSPDEDIIRFDIAGKEAMRLSTKTAGSTSLELSDGAQSTILGLDAGTNNISNLGVGGDDNSFYGYRAGNANTSGRFNTFLGSQSGRHNTTGIQNTSVGFLSLRSNTIGIKNTAIGVQSQYANTSGLSNTSLGFQTLYENTTGDRNVAIGELALQSNTTGNENTAIGSSALAVNSEGSRNTAIGYQTLFLNSEGFQNTAVGSRALYFNTAGIRNTATGFEALYSNTTATNNTANGYQALYSNTIGIYNTAVGHQASRDNTTGNYNSSVGYQALLNNVSGQNNTAIGHTALLDNTVANFNTAIGHRALRHITDLSFNTAVGAYAGDIYTFEASTFLGHGAYPNNHGFSNAMALGYNARSTASNQVRVGNSSITSIGGYEDWTTISDGRFKTDIQEDIPGLDFINKLHPVTYQLDVHKLASTLSEDLTTDEEGNRIQIEPGTKTLQQRDAKAAIRYSGFIAQEVENAASTLGYDFSGIDTPDDGEDFYGLRYASFVVPLVKAVQELSEENVSLQAQVNELMVKVDLLAAKASME